MPTVRGMNCDKICHVGGEEISRSCQNPVKVCPQKKTVSQNSKEFSDLCRKARFITMFRGTHHWTLSSVDKSNLQRRFNASRT
jgi:hypothetical protein